jgi:uncharacterized protein with GYD domain
MAVYMSQFSYTTEAWAALSKNPADRREGLRKLFESVGGRLIELYYSFGSHDGVILYEAPDDKAVAGAIIAALNAGHVRSISTTHLIPVEDMMAALKTAGSLSYAAPKS